MIFTFDMEKPKRNIHLTRAPHAVVPDLQPARGDVVAGHQPHPGLRVLAPRRGLVAPVRAVRHGVAQRGHAPALPAAAPPLVLDSLNQIIDNTTFLNSFSQEEKCNYQKKTLKIKIT